MSSLEQQLERVQGSLRDQVGSREQDVQERDKELQEANLQKAQLSESIRLDSFFLQRFLNLKHTSA